MILNTARAMQVVHRGEKTMSTPTVSPNQEAQQAPPKKRGIPKTGMNPGLAPNLVCQNQKCHAILKPKGARDNPSTGQLEVFYICDECGYQFNLSPEYAHGEYSAIGTGTKKLPEVFQK